ncbi:hypothetical protein EDD69_101271 [Thermolongibacillus altinsuensis]|uniref:Uncharacterized protein n=1 Tax=Thermolongibacillus altinsuensis TaxID=575256 RepID=A0A4R1QK65_9BACL|nr:hypothetical protein EDD69_101271 [Thermolongibacillus altinsuensis]
MYEWWLAYFVGDFHRWGKRNEKAADEGMKSGLLLPV